MFKRILILGASGTAGTAILSRLSRCQGYSVFGTYFSHRQDSAASMLYFSLEHPEKLYTILAQIRPDIVISCLRGDFNRQMLAHQFVTNYLSSAGGNLIFLSSANVFDGSCDRAHYESDPPNSISEYGQFKIHCESFLQTQLGRRAVILRLPFVWGNHSPRMELLKSGCQAGQLEVYTNLWSNHTSALQIADWIAWVIEEEKSGIFHVGTTDVIAYTSFIAQLIAALGMSQPKFLAQSGPGTMAVLNSRKDVPSNLVWNNARLIASLCGNGAASEVETHGRLNAF